MTTALIVQVHTEFNLPECLEEVMYMVAVKAHQKDLDLVIDIDKEVPKYVVTTSFEKETELFFELRFNNLFVRCIFLLLLDW